MSMRQASAQYSVAPPSVTITSLVTSPNPELTEACATRGAGARLLSSPAVTPFTSLSSFANLGRRGAPASRQRRVPPGQQPVSRLSALLFTNASVSGSFHSLGQACGEVLSEFGGKPFLVSLPRRLVVDPPAAAELCAHFPIAGPAHRSGG